MKYNIKKSILSLLLIAFVAPFSNAGSVTLGDSGWAMISSGDSVNVHVDSVGFDEVTIRLEKTFTGDIDEFGFFNPILIEFEKISELARSSIIIDSEMVLNNTNHTWHDYHMQLVIDPFNPEAGFTKSAPDGDNLEGVSYQQNYGYYGLPIQLDFLNTQGSGVDPETTFNPGLVSGDILIQTNVTEMEIGDRFGLKQVPTIPEPATVLLLVLGAVPAIAKRKTNTR